MNRLEFSVRTLRQLLRFTRSSYRFVPDEAQFVHSVGHLIFELGHARALLRLRVLHKKNVVFLEPSVTLEPGGLEGWLNDRSFRAICAHEGVQTIKSSCLLSRAHRISLPMECTR